MPLESVMDHFESPRNAGEVEAPDAVGAATNPVCGDEVIVSMRIEGEAVADMRYRVRGCHATVASLSLVSERIRGLPVPEAVRLTPEELMGWFASFPPGKAHAAEVAVRAIQDALGSRG